MIRKLGWATLFALVFATLAAAGCSDDGGTTTTGGKGTSQTTAGAEAKVLQIVLDGAADRQAELQAVTEYWKQVGIDAQVRVWEKATLLNKETTATRQAYSTDWGSATFDPFDLTIPKLKTDDRGNFSFYGNPKVDELLSIGASGSEAERAAAYKEAQAIIYEDAPWVFGYYQDIVHGVAKVVQGYKVSMDNRINLHDISRSDGNGTLVVGMNIDRLMTLDPADYRDRETETVVRNIFDGLVTRTVDGDVVPEIAESWTQPEPTVWEFKIRPGVKFHNGDPMTVDDVVFTFQRIMSETGVNGKQSPRLGLLGPTTAVEKADDSTVRFTLKEPSPVFLQLLVHTQIVPQKYLTEVGDAVFAQKPIGTGPFKAVSVKLDSEVVLEKFADYYGGSPDLPPVGPAQLDKVVFRMLPEPSTRVAALKAGEAQIIEDLPPDMEADIASDANLTVEKASGTRSYMIELNVKSLDDVRVRQALNYAVDWDAILEAIYHGRAHRLATSFLPSGFGYDPDLKPYPYDPEKAKALLTEAGYTVAP